MISRFRLSKIVVAVVLIVAGAAWGTSAGRPVVTRAETVVEHAFVAALIPAVGHADAGGRAGPRSPRAQPLDQGVTIAMKTSSSSEPPPGTPSPTKIGITVSAVDTCQL